MSEVTDRKRYVLNSEPLVLIPLAMFDALLDIQSSYREEAIAEASRAEEAEQRVMELSGELADYQDTDGYLLNYNRNQRNAIDKLTRQLAEADARCDNIFVAFAEKCMSQTLGGVCRHTFRESDKCNREGCPDIER